MVIRNHQHTFESKLLYPALRSGQDRRHQQLAKFLNRFEELLKHDKSRASSLYCRPAAEAVPSQSQAGASTAEPETSGETAELEPPWLRPTPPPLAVQEGEVSGPDKLMELRVGTRILWMSKRCARLTSMYSLQSAGLLSVTDSGDIGRHSWRPVDPQLAWHNVTVLHAFLWAASLVADDALDSFCPHLFGSQQSMTSPLLFCSSHGKTRASRTRFHGTRA